MDIEQPMMHIRLYRKGGRYVESADIKKREKKKEEEKEKKRKRKNTYTLADEQPSTLGVPDFKKGLGL
jgi:ribonucleotide reductase alpha subunit